jgi:Flp pilus assembly protein TadG
MRHTGRSSVRGGVLVYVTLALLALLGMAAFAIDVTRVHLAAQRAQNVADACAYAGGALLPDAAAAKDKALTTAIANNDAQPIWSATVGQSDVTYYGPGSTINRPDGSLITTLGSGSTALYVQAHCRVNFSLASLFGVDSSTPTRFAVVIRGPAKGVYALPIWISRDSEGLVPGGEPVNLVERDAAFDTNGDGVPDSLAPGSFGFLDMSVPGQDWFSQLLSGWNVADACSEAAYIELGTTVNAYTGMNVGQWTQPLKCETGALKGTARLERAKNDARWSQETYSPDNPESYSSDNPCIILVPIVDWLGGTGSNAEYHVVGFAEMWVLDVVNTDGGKGIKVQFMSWHYSTGGGEIDPGSENGVFVVRLIA